MQRGLEFTLFAAGSLWCTKEFGESSWTTDHHIHLQAPANQQGWGRNSGRSPDPIRHLVLVRAHKGGAGTEGGEGAEVCSFLLERENWRNSFPIRSDASFQTKSGHPSWQEVPAPEDRERDVASHQLSCTKGPASTLACRNTPRRASPLWENKLGLQLLPQHSEDTSFPGL